MSHLDWRGYLINTVIHVEVYIAPLSELLELPIKEEDSQAPGPALLHLISKDYLKIDSFNNLPSSMKSANYWSKIGCHSLGDRTQ